MLTVKKLETNVKYQMLRSVHEKQHCSYLLSGGNKHQRAKASLCKPFLLHPITSCLITAIFMSLLTLVLLFGVICTKYHYQRKRRRLSFSLCSTLGSVKGPIKDTYLISRAKRRGKGKGGGTDSDRKTDINQHAKQSGDSGCSL